MQNPPSSSLSALLDQVQEQLNEIKFRFGDARSAESYFERRYHDLENSLKRLEHRNTQLETRINEVEERLRRARQERDETKKELNSYRRVVHDAFMSMEEGRRDERDYNLGTHRQSNWEAEGSNTEIHNLGTEELESELDALEVRNQLLRRSTSPSDSPVPTAAYYTAQNENESSLLLSDRGVEDIGEASLTDDVEPIAAQMMSITSEWGIHFNNPPKASQIVTGPISWRKMAENVGLDEDVVRDLQRLLDPSSFKLGVAFMADMAFVHDPFFLEDLSEKKSYLIDWGDERMNGKVAQYIQRAGECCNCVFHTFVYVIGRRRWYYVSALQWTVGKVWDVWPTLTQPDKEAIGSRLWNRNQCARQTETIMEHLDCGELRQMCVELSASEHLVEHSRERLGLMGLTEARHRT